MDVAVCVDQARSAARGGIESVGVWVAERSARWRGRVTFFAAAKEVTKESGVPPTELTSQVEWRRGFSDATLAAAQPMQARASGAGVRQCASRWLASRTGSLCRG